jgi:hypothetical protein
MGQPHIAKATPWPRSKPPAKLSIRSSATVHVANRVQLGVQVFFGPSVAAGERPFLRRIAAVGCALRGPASIITVSLALLRVAGDVNIRSNIS